MIRYPWTSAGVVLPPESAQKCVQEKEVRFYMVTYEGLFQFSLVLLTALLVAAAFHGRKK
jgi:hypothetical protein